MADKKRKWALLRRREVLVPTWRGWLLFLLLAAGLMVVAVRQVHPFLALTEPSPGGLLVVEGWAPDYVLEEALAEFKRNHYDKLYVTGGPMELGGVLTEYKTYAQVGAVILIHLGMQSNAVQAVPAPWVRFDRTYVAALTLKNWLRTNGISPAKIHLITEGTHSRRSRLLNEKAFGKGVQIGVTSIPDQSYDPEHWWRSSSGGRVVLSEAIGYVYARFLFRAPPELKASP
jgi:uncharacterized SAM-binding protein YcdF (DUF218 family)